MHDFLEKLFRKKMGEYLQCVKIIYIRHFPGNTMFNFPVNLFGCSSTPYSIIRVKIEKPMKAVGESSWLGGVCAWHGISWAHQLVGKSTYWIFIKLRRFEAHLELKCKDSYLNTWDVNSALLCVYERNIEKQCNFESSTLDALFFTRKIFTHLSFSMCRSWTGTLPRNSDHGGQKVSVDLATPKLTSRPIEFWQLRSSNVDLDNLDSRTF